MIIWQKFKPNQINFLLNTQQSANLFNFDIKTDQGRYFFFKCICFLLLPFHISLIHLSRLIILTMWYIYDIFVVLIFNLK